MSTKTYRCLRPIQGHKPGDTIELDPVDGETQIALGNVELPPPDPETTTTAPRARRTNA